MRHFFTWLLVFGILAGLNARVLAAYHDEHSACAHAHEDCGGPDPGDHPSSGDHQHDEKCPPDHHHCGSCLHSLPLTVENDLIHRLAAPEFSRSQVRPESDLPPDGPFSALDKPPLI